MNGPGEMKESFWGCLPLSLSDHRHPESRAVLTFEGSLRHHTTGESGQSQYDKRSVRFFDLPKPFSHQGTKSKKDYKF
ncbi:MAG: hypothetical protein QME74_07230 [Candidatus Edwardsbacteria bacterium]|nr:hypothetical protein [Candidatus Edwardsbacteria bacterium]